MQLGIQKPFRKRLQSWRYNTKPPCYSVKLFKRQTTTPSGVFCKKDVVKNFAKNSQENTCLRVSSFLETLLKSDSSTNVFLWNLRRFSGHLSCRTKSSSQKNPWAEVSSFLETLLKSESITGVFLWNLRSCSGHLSCRTPKNGCFCVGFFLEAVRKFQKIF